MPRSEAPKKHLVVLTGAGMSAESGLKTFRDSGGLWEGYEVQDVATPEAWQRNPQLVLRFYNERRRDLLQAKPNAGHLALAELESKFRVTVITQNVDDLHERAGSTNVLHLHGELKKARSSVDPKLVYDIKGSELTLGERCEKGSQLRPHIVWFGEAVPLIEEAVIITQSAEVFAVIGTSLAVYPAAGLLDYVGQNVPIYLIDPHIPDHARRTNVEAFAEPASTGVPKLAKLLQCCLSL